MIFRHARHTSCLDKIEKFYTDIVGLEKLGSFENHSNYNGIFLGHKNSNWHLEFTSSNEKPTSKYDEDDIFVFYVNSELELGEIKKEIKKKKLSLENPKNPYWSEHGIMISDPDNYKVIFAIKHLNFKSKDELTNLVKSKGVTNWSELIEFIRNLPYGRNSNREDFTLLLNENKGTCSSKHAFIKKVADLNGFENVKLILGIYKMNHFNTPNIGYSISTNGLKYIPEAHCYLKLNNRRMDFTTSNSEFENLRKDIIEEIEIEPEQVNIFKVQYHKNFLQNWIEQENIQLNFDKIWNIREECIKRIEETYTQ